VVKLTEAGDQNLDHIAAHNANRQLAIIFRGTLLAAPTLRASSPYPEGRFVIDGLFTKAELHKIIDALNRAPTPSSSRVFGSASNAVLPYLAKGGTNCVLLDLDTRRWATNTVYRPEASEWWDWMCGEGMDMLALGKMVPQIIVCFDLGLVPVENPEWDTLTAADVLNCWPLMTTGARHQEQLRHDPNTTNTYLFRTREGGRGILQILGNSADPPGVGIRYKLVQAPASSKREPAAQGRQVEGSGEVSVVARNVADAGSKSASQPARLELQQAQADLAEAKARHDAGLVSLSELQTAQLARDLAEAEMSGDTAAVLRAKLGFAQEQLLQAQGRFKAGLATQAEVERARLTKDLAEARLSRDGKAIGRAEFNLAQQEFLRVEGLFKAKLATQAEFEKAKLAKDLAEARLAGDGKAK
jgi:hypothetical protein